MNSFFKITFFASLVGFSLAATHKGNGTLSTVGLQLSSSAKTVEPRRDSTSPASLMPLLMPYNRLIDPAGIVVKFGDPGLENHSLDLALIPGTPYIAIEDRYGIAVMDTRTHTLNARYSFPSDPKRKNLMSTYSGIKVLKEDGAVHIFWSASSEPKKPSYVIEASFIPRKLSILNAFSFNAVSSPMALPNDLAITTEDSRKFLYVTLNGNNQLAKMSLATGLREYTVETGVAPYGVCLAGGKVFVSNWGGPVPPDETKAETAGVPYGAAFTSQVTGATSQGSISVFTASTGKLLKEIPVGLHPNAIITSPDGQYVFVAEANSDAVSVIKTGTLNVTEQIPVNLIPGKDSFIGDSPDALAINAEGTVLYVANGLDNAVAVVRLGRRAATAGFESISKVEGFIPTEAYPGGLALDAHTLYVANLEAEGARVSNKEAESALDTKAKSEVTAYNSHHQKASISFISVPDAAQLKAYTQKTLGLNFTYREDLARLLPRAGRAPVPMPERIGEPSIFKHVVYIIKENRTYDQVLGDMPEGNGAPQLCIFGENITPNQHLLARNYVLLDNYYASGKCSAEGHQWTDAGMVTDYVEKNVRAWFRSYPHVQNDALVYDANGFIWNHAADHGKNVRIYGEASVPVLDTLLSSKQIYQNYLDGKKLNFKNSTTISRVRSMLSPTYPGSDDLRITDQIRADAFIAELKEAEQHTGDEFPELSVMALSDDHTEGTRPGLPTPRAMVADNDLALGRIVEAITKSRFWKNTVIFVTEDDSQAGWDHVSAYRTTGFVVSAYSKLSKPVAMNYNQVSMLRSVEQVLGIPPMNIMDATASPMFDCFQQVPVAVPFTHVPSRISINERNPGIAGLTGKALKYARDSQRPEFDHVDGGRDQLLNQIVWFSVKGDKPYPFKLSGKDADGDD